MSRIEKAQERLARAVARLERARNTQSERLAEMKEALNVEPGAGPEAGDISDLIHALEEAQRENAALVAEREAVADRVDAILGSVRRAAGINDNERAGSDP